MINRELMRIVYEMFLPFFRALSEEIVDISHEEILNRIERVYFNYVDVNKYNINSTEFNSSLQNFTSLLKCGDYDEVKNSNNKDFIPINNIFIKTYIFFYENSSSFDKGEYGQYIDKHLYYFLKNMSFLESFILESFTTDTNKELYLNGFNKFFDLFFVFRKINTNLKTTPKIIYEIMFKPFIDVYEGFNSKDLPYTYFDCTKIVFNKDKEILGIDEKSKNLLTNFMLLIL